MYSLYRKSQEGNATRYVHVDDVSLFGSKNGYIVRLLKLDMPQKEQWHINISETLKKDGKDGQTLIINLKPHNHDKELSLYEITDIWGYSTDYWTPVMLHLRGLFVDDTSDGKDQNDFTWVEKDSDKLIFTITYINGGMEKGGKLTREWLAPRPSPTNSALLWPETFDYFIKSREEFKSILAKQEKQRELVD